MFACFRGKETYYHDGHTSLPREFASAPPPPLHGAYHNERRRSRSWPHLGLPALLDDQYRAHGTGSAAFEPAYTLSAHPDLCFVCEGARRPHVLVVHGHEHTSDAD